VAGNKQKRVARLRHFHFGLRQHRQRETYRSRLNVGCLVQFEPSSSPASNV
jgi:hypothetical protein